jgi:dephospho-CoA kinase
MGKTLVCTGGIGSGKSYVTDVFSRMGVPVYDADSRTKRLYETDSGLLDSLKDLLGDTIVRNGRLDKKRLASLIFTDNSLLEKVNGIVHPIVLEDFKRWKKENLLTSNLLLMESAIFFSVPIFHSEIDKVLLIYAPVDLRIRRVVSRDGCDEKSVIMRMENQCSYEDMRDRADFIIFADGKHAVLPQVVDVLKICDYL